MVENSFVSTDNPTSTSGYINTKPKKRKNELDVFEQLDQYLKSREHLITERSMKAIRTSGEHLLKFQEFRGKKITFECFDHTFYEEFLKFLTYDIPQYRKEHIKGLKRNTVAKNH